MAKLFNSEESQWLLSIISVQEKNSVWNKDKINRIKNKIVENSEWVQD